MKSLRNQETNMIGKLYGFRFRRGLVQYVVYSVYCTVYCFVLYWIDISSETQKGLWKSPWRERTEQQQQPRSTQTMDDGSRPCRYCTRCCNNIGTISVFSYPNSGYE
jgi:hypothetical protein